MPEALTPVAKSGQTMGNTISRLIIANVAAPFILSKTGNFFIFASMIPVEMLVIWLLFKAWKTKISFPRLLIICVVANIATSIIGIPLVYNPLITPSPGVMLIVLPICFLLSSIFESIIYIPLFRSNGYNISIPNILKLSFLSNLASYTVFVIVLLPVSLNSNLFSEGNPARARLEIMIMWMPGYLHQQQEFYIKNSRFASNFKELQLDSLERESQLYRYEMQAEKLNTTISVTSKVENISTYRGTVFVVKNKLKASKIQFISGICKTNSPSIKPPEMPQLVNNNLQCPPGAVKTSTGT